MSIFPCFRVIFSFRITRCPQCKEIDRVQKRVYLNFSTDGSPRMKKITDELNECQLKVQIFAEYVGRCEQTIEKQSEKLESNKIEICKLHEKLLESDRLNAQKLSKCVEENQMLRQCLAKAEEQCNEKEQTVKRQIKTEPTLKMQIKKLPTENQQITKEPTVKRQMKKTPTENVSVPTKIPKIPTRSSSRIRALADRTNKK